jgi:hypothetical protein
MVQKLRAIYRTGAFIPQDEYSLPEETVVELTVEIAPLVRPPRVDSAEREQRLRLLILRMQQNQIPSGAKPFARDELHERGRHVVSH